MVNRHCIAVTSTYMWRADWNHGNSSKNYTDMSDKAYQEIIRDTLQQIDLVQRLTIAYPSVLAPAHSAADVWAHFHKPDPVQPRISSLLGIEGLHQIGNSASVLRTYHALGVRYASLTHTCHNIYADSSEAASGPLHGGLSVAGRAIVREMNRLGMIVDLSHASADTARDVLRHVARAPVLFSHSAAGALCPHPRNVPDDVLDLLKVNGGVVMVSFYPPHVHCGEPGDSAAAGGAEASLADVADHVMYVGERIGFRHVGIGSDFDGMAKGPLGLEDVSKYRDLVAELLRRGVGRADMEGVVGANVLRVLADVESVARELRDELPLEDDVKDMFS